MAYEGSELSHGKGWVMNSADSTSDDRTDEERKTDEEYNSMILRILGTDAVAADRAMRRNVTSNFVGGVTIVTDSSDPGYGRSTPIAEGERSEFLMMVREAAREAFAGSESPMSEDEAGV